MKKFLAGVVVGHTIGGFVTLWVIGGWGRFAELYKRAGNGESFDSLPDIMEYIIEGKGSCAPRQNVAEERDGWFNSTPEAYFAKYARARAMHSEGYSNAEIAEQLGVSENSVKILFTRVSELEQ